MRAALSHLVLAAIACIGPVACGGPDDPDIVTTTPPEPARWIPKIEEGPVTFEPGGAYYRHGYTSADVMSRTIFRNDCFIGHIPSDGTETMSLQAGRRMIVRVSSFQEIGVGIRGGNRLTEHCADGFIQPNGMYVAEMTETFAAGDYQIHIAPRLNADKAGHLAKYRVELVDIDAHDPGERVDDHRWSTPEQHAPYAAVAAGDGGRSALQVTERLVADLVEAQYLDDTVRTNVYLELHRQAHATISHYNRPVPGFSPEMMRVEAEPVDARHRVRLGDDVREFSIPVTARASESLAPLGLGPFCVGYADRSAPTAVIDLDFAGNVRYLMFTVLHDTIDTVLAIRFPNGSWYCNDDGYERDPQLHLPHPEAGVYTIWVGQALPGEPADVELKVMLDGD